MAGILEVTAADYHADKVSSEQPTLSRTIAKILCQSSPKHAWAAHPRLNPDYRPYDDEKFDVGTVAHAMLLQGEDVAVVVDAADWRTNAAKDERDAARVAGQVPLLTKHWDAVQAMVAATRSQLDAIEVSPPLFTDGKPEQTIVWDDDGVTCRARPDWLRTNWDAIDDYKTTSRSANPESWSRSLFGMGYDIQVAFYLRGAANLTGHTPAFRFVVQETYPPYALSVVSLAPDALALAQKKVQHAIDLWRRCLATDTWPAYTTKVCWAESPTWAEADWMQREALEEVAA